MIANPMVGAVAGGVLASSGDRIPPGPVLVTGGALLVGVLYGVHFWRRRWAILDTPTSKAIAVFAGRSEVVGRAEPFEPSEPLTAPVIGEPAVWFRWLLQRMARGDSRRWDTIREEASDRPFWLVDDTGRVLVWPAGARIQPTQVFHQRAHRSGITHLHHEGRPLGELGRRYRVLEWCIRPGQPLYVLGRATRHEATGAMQFGHDDEGRPGPSGRRRDDDRLLISTHDQAHLAHTSLLLAVLFLVIGWVGATLLPAAIHAMDTYRSTGPEPGSPSTLAATGTAMVAAAELYGVLLLGGFLLRVHHRLILVQQQVANAWSMIDVALRRRHDLLPNLVAVARRHATQDHGHEHLVIEAAGRARAGAVLPAREELPSDETLRRAAELHRTEQAHAAALLSLAEAHPDLQADEVFQDLARRLTDTENQVTYARTFYNDAVVLLHDRRRTFPGTLLARTVRTPSWHRFAPDRDTDPPPATRPSPAP